MAEGGSGGGEGAEPVVREYERLAPVYDQRWGNYVAASVGRTLGRIDLRAGERVLDVGAGTGALLSALAEREPAASLSGVDASPAMLARARAKLGARANLFEAQAENLPFEAGSFDLLVSTSVFHHLRRPREALREWRRVLRPGGRIALTDWCDDFLACRVCDRVLRLVSASHFRTYGLDDLGRMLAEAGFEELALERYRISWLWGMMTATGRAPRAAPARPE